MKRAPLLVFGIGNPSRGDDALGPLFVERAGALLADAVARGELELLTDFQLQIEHALDLEDRARVVFVDASVRALPPFELTGIVACAERSVSTHSMSPEAVLEVYRTLGRGAGSEGGARAPLEAWVLAIRGERFELGEPLSAQAAAHLEAALALLVARLRGGGEWSPVIGAGEPHGPAGRRLVIEGIVQGVGFRPWVHRTASALGLRGRVWNTPNGITVDAFGAASALDALLLAVQRDAPPAAHVASVRQTPLTPDPTTPTIGFVIAASAQGGTPAMVLPPDLATCEACLKDTVTPGDRHHAYAFTSCSACGPRLAVALALPYDRAATTMAPFAPCAACAREYGDPDDRRFHAQTVACPACGPRLWLADPRGVELPRPDPLAAAAALLVEGKILGIQGLGAFHLVCDATDTRAVAELRRRKRRDLQPFAVMVADLTSATAYAELDPHAQAALTSEARPIVLAPARGEVVVAAVRGPSSRAGLMLPYTPLHARLLALTGRPLVFTSGNVRGGPAVIDHASALTDLGPLVDAFVLHDRRIARRVEDSLLASAPGGVRVLRRARGLAPRPIRLPVAAPEPVLAVGGHGRNTACLVLGDRAYLTPHLGDLGLYAAEVAWRCELEGFEALLGVRAEVLAHDLHPDYASTRYALARPARRRVGVQHHVAHALAALAELHPGEPVVAVVYDGTGWGPDGTAWGAEILLVDGARWTRVSSFRPMPLPGGERAIREPWRAALGVLHEAFGPEEALALTARLPVFVGTPHATLAALLRAIDAGIGTAKARGMGRWFDAVAALALDAPRAGFDGHLAIALEDAASPGDAAHYPFAPPAALAIDVALGAAHEIDLRPTVRALVRDRLAGTAPAQISARFHRTVIDATCGVVAAALAETGLRRVVLSGGSMQNTILARGLVERLGAERVLVAREVPLNDGGLALGQAWAAVLALAAEGA